jgi:hypothetical protein
VTERTEAEVEEWRKERNITIEGKAAKPITSWVEARLPDYICDYIEAKHFVTVSCFASAFYRFRLVHGIVEADGLLISLA